MILLFFFSRKSINENPKTYSVFRRKKKKKFVSIASPKKKKIVSHIKLNGVIGNVGKFKQGIDFAGQEEIIKKAFSLKKISAVAISINSPGGSPVQSHLIYKFIRQQAQKKKIKVIVFAEDVAASGG